MTQSELKYGFRKSEMILNEVYFPKHRSVSSQTETTHNPKMQIQ